MNAVASNFGGGGNVHEAGFIAEGSSLQSVEEKIILLLKDIV
jgi:nanoRNase/pAp phosphatase (c-di-AMP/oligoRNAs hydrolase)